MPLNYARPRPWETTYWRIPDAAVSPERIAAAREGAATAADLLGEAQPSIRWFAKADWRDGYDFAVEGISNGFATFGKPGVINLSAGLSLAETAHVAAHEVAHLIQLAGGPPTASTKAKWEAEAEAFAEGICRGMKNSCNRCATTGNRPLDFVTLQRQRDARAAVSAMPPAAAIKRPSTTRGRAPVVLALGHVSDPAALGRRIEDARAAGYLVDLGAGPESAGSARQRLDRWIARASSEPKRKESQQPRARPGFGRFDRFGGSVFA